jgi:hypothetical protein
MKRIFVYRVFLFVHFFGLQHDMHTNNDRLIYLCIRPYKNPLTKQVFQESSVMIQQTCISVLHTNHTML